MEHPEQLPALAGNAHSKSESVELMAAWRRLGRAATFVALLTSPAVFLWFHEAFHWKWYWALLATIGVVALFRGMIDVLSRRLIPWPSTFGIVDPATLESEVVARRRVWFWRSAIKTVIWVAI